MSCLSCGKTLSAPDNAAGKKAKCPFCGEIMTVPETVLDAEAVGVGVAGPSGGLGQTTTPPSPAAGSQARQPCPECGEMIVVGAAKCRFCNAIFDPELKKNRLGRRGEDLRQIASYQRGVIFCILIQVLAYVAFATFGKTSPAFVLIPRLAVLCAVIAGVCFAVLLAMRVYSTGAGIAMGLLAIVPCLGLVMLLIINQAATRILTDNGIKVGLFGASMSQF